MIKEDLNDTDAPEEIKQFVRDHDHIEFTHFVDRGFNGMVYFGKRIKMNEAVVVKFYNANKAFDESEEAVILRNINHENILKVDDIRFLPHFNTYFLSPLISGGDLQNLIDHEIIPSKRALCLVKGLLLGLNELHSQHQLVHRDLKPANLLFDLDSDIPVIADLGSVKKIDNLSLHTTASKSTYLYLPPESIKRNEYSIKSDIYQMGITLYQLLGGYFPLDTPVDFLTDRERKQLMKVERGLIWNQKLIELLESKIVKGKLLNLNSLPEYLPARFKTVIRKACHIDNEKRYSSASEFLTDINKLIRDFPSYCLENEILEVIHDTGKIYSIDVTDQSKCIVSKSVNGRPWRRVKTMDGDLKQVIMDTSK